MVFRIKLRGKEWLMERSCGYLQTADPPYGEKLPFEDLTVEEARALSTAEAKAYRAWNEHYNAERKEAYRQIAEGDASFRGDIWHVESDHVWRLKHDGTMVTLKFSDLTDKEINCVTWLGYGRKRTAELAGS